MSVLAFLLVLPFLLHAQDPVTLQFTGRNQYGQYVQLESVYVENLTKRWQEMLYYPDTTLKITETGVDDFDQNGKGVRLFQNVPNPFDGVTDFALQLLEATDVLLEIYDLDGKVETTYKGSLDQGTHQFRAWLETPQTYLLNARTENGAVRIKMVNTGRAGQNRIEYLGQGTSLWVDNPKNGSKGEITMPFNDGDTMLYKGYAYVEGTGFESAPVVKAQYGSELIPLTFTLPQPAFYCGIDTVTDYDGNVYHTVEIGQQCWMKENLRTTHFPDGIEIPFGETISNSDNTPYRYAPNGNYGNVPLYGYLYNWAAVMHGAELSNAVPSGVQGICPIGWHVPSGLEFQLLIDYVGSQSKYLCGGDSSYIGKALASTTWWSSSPTNACNVGYDIPSNNATGFSALPAGTRNPPGVSDDLGNRAYFYTASIISFLFDISDPQIQMNFSSQDKVYSVRCLLDYPEIDDTMAVAPVVTTESLDDILTTTATCKGFVTATGGAEVTACGVCWSTSPNPTLNDSHTVDGAGTGRFTSYITGLMPGTTYHLRTYATNCVGTSYGEERTITTYCADSCGGLTVTDYDGNVYHTVLIGQQCWLRENMRTTHYSDGTAITLGSITSTTTPYFYYPAVPYSEINTFGYLYNWVAAMHGNSSSSTNPSGVQGVCPTGWHVPSDAEWLQLSNYLSGQNEYSCGGDSNNVAKALASTKAWSFSKENDNECVVGYDPTTNNATGFSALPAGREGGPALVNAFFWTTTQTNYSIFD